MNIKVFQNRKVSKDYFDNEGTQNENYSTTLSFEVPLGYEDFSKRIVFITEDGNFWDYIKDNEYVIKNNITKYENIEAYLWLTKDNQDFRSETFELNFYENQNPDDMTPSEEQLDGYNTLIAELELKVEEVDALKEETLEALEKLKEQQIDYENRFEEINGMLKELKDTNEYQSEIIDQFKNEFDEKEFKGANAHLPDSAELPLKLQPQGNIEQDTREGYQLLNVKDLSSKAITVGVTVDDNDYVTGRSTDDRDWSYASSNWFELLKAGDYTLIILTKQAGTNTNIGLAVNTSDSKRLTTIGHIDLANAVTIKTFTLEEDAEVGVFFKVYDGIYRVLLVEGTYTSDNMPPYEKFGQMPSIAFPSEVKGVGSEEHINYCSEIEVGNINANGNNFNDETSIRSKNYDEIEPNTTYIASLNGNAIGFNYTQYDENKTSLGRNYASNGIFTTSENAKYVRVQALASIDNSVVQINKGTEIKPYTPYGYCRYETVVENKNLLENNLTSKTINGLDVVVNNDKTIIINGTATTTTVLNLINDEIGTNASERILKKGTYTLSGCPSGGGGSTNYKLDINTPTAPFMTDIGNKITSTFEEDKTYTGIRIVIYSGCVCNNLTFKPMLEKGKVATEYTPHLQQTFPIDLPIGMKMYNDEFFYKENGKWYRKVEWEKLYAKDLSWRINNYTDGYKQFYATVNNAPLNGSDVYSNHFVRYAGNISGHYEGNFVYTNYTSSLIVCPAPKDASGNYITDVETFKSATQNTYFVYKTLASTREEITDLILIQELEDISRAFSYYPVTNVNSYKPTVNVADLILNGKYYVSNKAKFKTLEERVSALENETVNE